VTRCVIEFCCTGRQLDATGATSKRQRRGQEPHRAVLRAEVFDTVGKPLPTSCNFGFAVAHAYAGHTDGAGDTGSATSTYVRATLTEVATALAALTSEPHPLAEPEGRPA
jgi:hypothetical protein